MGALQHGDDQALNLLMNRWQAPLRGFIQRYTQNGPDALDLAQETFVRIYLHRARFRPGAKFSTWLFAIALNLCRNRARWLKRHPTIPIADDPDAPGANPPVSPGPAPDADALSAERAAAVRAAIAALPPELRAAVVLFEYEHQSHAEIAASAGVTAKAIETRLYRARLLLKKELARFLREP